MTGRSEARKFILESAEEIKNLHNKGCTLKEIHGVIKNLKDNIHYATFVRNISKLDIIQVDTKNEKAKNEDSTKIHNFVNEKNSPEPGEKISSNAQKNREKLSKSKTGFKYDHSTNDKDFI
ncbi:MULTISPECIES: hypothetical protein [unclassified Acinetobacter]|uniref:hypothetical protein n=1 Tax=unclassified Acinetobacter TaxID=196816 RepID=UPI0015D41F7F|nr:MULTISPECIES: hypothetical protein [unclassified Acinetobacter]UUS62524.1 hypothetical protein MST17_16860 [Acinetobacter sp. YH16056_T]